MFDFLSELLSVSRCVPDHTIHLVCYALLTLSIVILSVKTITDKKKN